MKTPSIRNILVPIDFSRMSIQAIETAKGYAQRFGATIHLAHVHQFFRPAAGFIPPTPPLVPYSTFTYDQEAEKRAARDLQLLAKKHELRPPTTTHVLTGGPAFDEICRLARDLPADLIITPTHGRTGLKHVLIGSTAERIVQHSPCPVFISRRRKKLSRNGARGSVDTVLVPVDFSECSRRGLKYAIAFADKVAAKIMILHVIQPECQYAANAWAMYDVSALKQSREKEAARQMQDFLRSTKFGRVQFETVIRTGYPVSEICAFAQDRAVDLIITSTHGWTGLKHVLIGSAAEHLVRHAPCSVLVVPSHPEVRAAQLTRGATRIRKAGPPKRPQQFAPGFMLTRKSRKIGLNPFPERRKTNKFRESHPQQ